jgi:lipoprotein-anchoring transpeptidase ErfK/SrfK
MTRGHMRRGKHRRRTVLGPRWLRIGLLTLVVLGLVFSGTAYAGFRYDRAHFDRILPGVTIGGVSVAGMTRAEAIAAVGAEVEGRLERPITVTAAGERLSITPEALGTTADVPAAVDQALGMTDEFSWTRRVIARLWNRGVGRAVDLPVQHDEAAIAAWLGRIADARNVTPEDASVDWVDGELALSVSKPGRALRRGLGTRATLAALEGEATTLTLPFKRLVPKVTEENLGHTIVVRTSMNALYLFDGLELAKEYGVATGTPGYPTPHGHFTIVNKRYNPTWVNPAPNGWGRGMPASIGPGPGNPLGTRALDLDAPGIRIHGTYADYSIGTAASHGCIRMHIAQSEELFEIVDVGTPVIIVP